MTSSPDAGVARRSLLGGGPVGLLGETVRQAPALAGAGRRARGGTPMSAAAVTPLHLLRRTTFGPTPALLAAVHSTGTTAWLARQLTPTTIPDPLCDSVVARWPHLALSIPRVHEEEAAGRLDGWELMWQLVLATIARATWSERQLLEVMVDFWSNHLNVACPSDNVWDCRAHYDASVIRRYAFGSFSDMLCAATLHPAMLRYLNNDVSDAEHPNENLGRELLELHTVGVDGGYTEDDVLDAARILTGLTVDYDTGEYVYKPRRHWRGAVRVLGFEHPNASRDDGPAVTLALVRYLARRPETARRIAHKLAVRFVGDEPPARLVTVLARAYLRHDTEIVPVLWELFSSREFAAAAGQKVRRPFEDVVATVRALGLRPDATGTDGIQGLGWILADLGHAPLGWPTPDGYPDIATAWQSPAATLGKWNTHMSLAANWWPDTLQRDPIATLVPSPRPATYGALVDALAARVLFEPLSTAQRTAACTFLDGTPSTKLTASSEVLDWRLAYLVALLLDTPQHAVR